MLLQLHLLRNSLRAAHELRWGFFISLHTGTGPGGRVHRDTAPIIRCIYWRAMRNSCVKSSVRTQHQCGDPVSLVPMANASAAVQSAAGSAVFASGIATSG